MDIPEPAGVWADGLYCGSECYKKLVELGESFTEEGLQRVVVALGNEFYGTDTKEGLAFTYGFIAGYKAQERRGVHPIAEETDG